MQTSDSIKEISAALVGFNKEVGKIPKDAKNPFFKSNERFYVYEHRRNDTGMPFYVGKGTGRRAYQIIGRNEYWKNIVATHGYTVVISKDNLTEIEAYGLEVGLIILNKLNGFCEANMSIGGDGVTVAKRWWGDKISQSLKGKASPKGKESKSYKDFSSKSELFNLYVKQNVSSAELSKRFDVSIPTVINRLRSFGIPVKRCGKKNIQIMCINDGRRFDTIKDAANEYGLFRENIKKVLTGKYKHTGGLTFKYLQNDNI